MQGVEAYTEVARRSAAATLRGASGEDRDVQRWKTLGALAPHPDVDELSAKPDLKDDDWSRLDLADMVSNLGSPLDQNLLVPDDPSSSYCRIAEA